jgi:hypothetical protein
MINENLVNALTLGLFGSVGALSFIQASYALVMYLKNWPTDALLINWKDGSSSMDRMLI